MAIFTLVKTVSEARAGVLHTERGDIPTPVFMPVATQGSVKALDPDDLKAIGARVILGNTYHLYLRPDLEVIESLGGLHHFVGWQGPILTDSGGFQGFSLEHLRKISEEGILFTSHIDGSLHNFTPEAVIDYQQRMGSDIIMPLDVCVPTSADNKAIEEALERTGRWANRSIHAWDRKSCALFGIVQGGLVPDFRERSASLITSLGFDGYAIGGLSVGESKSQMYNITTLTTKLLPANAPRYLMGVGSPEDLVEAVARGVDMFDCVLPTRIARNGSLLVATGRTNIDKSPFRKRDGPIEPDCDCYTCKTFSCAYLHHLFKAKELLAYRLASIHNLRFIFRLMRDIRQAIIEETFESYRENFHRHFIPPNEETRRSQKLKWLQSLKRSRTTVGK